MKRLFQVKQSNGKTFTLLDGKVFYTDNKPHAKLVRDQLNGEFKNGGYTVAPGPDHRNFRG